MLNDCPHRSIIMRPYALVRCKKRARGCCLFSISAALRDAREVSKKNPNWFRCHTHTQTHTDTHRHTHTHPYIHAKSFQHRKRHHTHIQTHIYTPCSSTKGRLRVRITAISSMYINPLEMKQSQRVG